MRPFGRVCMRSFANFLPNAQRRMHGALPFRYMREFLKSCYMQVRGKGGEPATLQGCKRAMLNEEPRTGGERQTVASKTKSRINALITGGWRVPRLMPGQMRPSQHHAALSHMLYENSVYAQDNMLYEYGGSICLQHISVIQSSMTVLRTKAKSEEHRGEK